VRRLDAAVLLMPTYNVAHEDDAQVCGQLMERLADVRVELALIDDPTLYKSVAGHLTLMLSARMHPLILAAGMGVPIVALAYNGKFAALFELLRLPPRLIALDDFAVAPQARRLELHALASLVDRVDLPQRCAELAAQVRRRTLALFDSVEAA
jgi:polysaccharide pyruvyl transferase WcaK-like protein